MHVFIFFQPAQKANTFSIKSGLGFGPIVVNFYTHILVLYLLDAMVSAQFVLRWEHVVFGNVNIFDCGVITTKLHIAKSGNEGLTKVIQGSWTTTSSRFYTFMHVNHHFRPKCYPTKLLWVTYRQTELNCAPLGTYYCKLNLQPIKK